MAQLCSFDNPHQPRHLPERTQRKKGDPAALTLTRGGALKEIPGNVL